MFQAMPIFRRAARGYDRFQVDSYAQWAEEELAGAARLRDDPLTRNARLRAELDECRRSLAHSPASREFTGLSYRLGSMLSAAAEQADGMRADAEAELATATAVGARMLADAAEAERSLRKAAAEAARLGAEADRLPADAKLTA
jgi:cell division septum initiation protein DivIVA